MGQNGVHDDLIKYKEDKEITVETSGSSADSLRKLRRDINNMSCA